MLGGAAAATYDEAKVSDSWDNNFTDCKHMSELKTKINLDIFTDNKIVFNEDAKPSDFEGALDAEKLNILENVTSVQAASGPNSDGHEIIARAINDKMPKDQNKSDLEVKAKLIGCVMSCKELNATKSSTEGGTAVSQAFVAALTGGGNEAQFISVMKAMGLQNPPNDKGQIQAVLNAAQTNKGAAILAYLCGADATAIGNAK